MNLLTFFLAFCTFWCGLFTVGADKKGPMVALTLGMAALMVISTIFKE